MKTSVFKTHTFRYHVQVGANYRREHIHRPNKRHSGLAKIAPKRENLQNFWRFSLSQSLSHYLPNSSVIDTI